jgi:hypothetical protein
VIRMVVNLHSVARAARRIRKANRKTFIPVKH